MDLRITRAEIALFAPPLRGTTDRVEALRLAAGRAHDAALLAVARRVMDGFGAMVRGRRTRRALAALSDRQLADIGLVRADIDRMV